MRFNSDSNQSVDEWSSSMRILGPLKAINTIHESINPTSSTPGGTPTSSSDTTAIEQIYPLFISQSIAREPLTTFDADHSSRRLELRVVGSLCRLDKPLQFGAFALQSFKSGASVAWAGGVFDSSVAPADCTDIDDQIVNDASDRLVGFQRGAPLKSTIPNFRPKSAEVLEQLLTVDPWFWRPSEVARLAVDNSTAAAVLDSGVLFAINHADENHANVTIVNGHRLSPLDYSMSMIKAIKPIKKGAQLLITYPPEFLWKCSPLIDLTDEAAAQLSHPPARDDSPEPFTGIQCAIDKRDIFTDFNKVGDAPFHLDRSSREYSVMIAQGVYLLPHSDHSIPSYQSNTVPYLIDGVSEQMTYVQMRGYVRNGAVVLMDYPSDPGAAAAAASASSIPLSAGKLHMISLVSSLMEMYQMAHLATKTTPERDENYPGEIQEDASFGNKHRRLGAVCFFVDHELCADDAQRRMPIIPFRHIPVFGDNNCCPRSAEIVTNRHRLSYARLVTGGLAERQTNRTQETEAAGGIRATISSTIDMIAGPASSLNSSLSYLRQQLHLHFALPRPENDPAGFASRLKEMKEQMSRVGYQPESDLFAFWSINSGASLRVLWPWYHRIPGQSAYGSYAKGKISNVLSGLFVSDIGMNKTYPSKAVEKAEWSYDVASDEFARGYIMKLPRHFEAMVEAPELLAVINSPCLPAGFFPSQMQPITDSIANTDFLLPEAIFNMSSLAASVRDTALAEWEIVAGTPLKTRSSVHPPKPPTSDRLYCKVGDIIESGSAPPFKRSVVAWIKIGRSEVEHAKKKVGMAFDRTIEGMSSSSSSSGGDSPPTGNELQSLREKVVATFSHFSPSLSFLVVDAAHLLHAVNGKTSWTSSLVKIGKHQPKYVAGDCPADYFQVVRANEIVRVLQPHEFAPLFEKNARVPLNHVEILKTHLPRSHADWSAKYFLDLTSTYSMVNTLHDTTPERTVELDRLRDRLITKTFDLGDIAQRDLFTQTMHLSSTIGMGIAEFAALYRYVARDRPLFRPANFEPVMDFYRKNKNSFVCGLGYEMTTGQKVKLIAIYKPEFQISLIEPKEPTYLSSSGSAMEKGEAASAKSKWSSEMDEYRFLVNETWEGISSDPKVPTTMKLLLQSIAQNKAIDWSRFTPAEQLKQIKDERANPVVWSPPAISRMTDQAFQTMLEVHNKAYAAQKEAFPSLTFVRQTKNRGEVDDFEPLVYLLPTGKSRLGRGTPATPWMHLSSTEFKDRIPFNDFHTRLWAHLDGKELGIQQRQAQCAFEVALLSRSNPALYYVSSSRAHTRTRTRTHAVARTQAE